jgi:hypothetical protein
VFTAEDGMPVHADHLAQRFERLVTGSGQPTIRFHDYADIRPTGTDSEKPTPQDVDKPTGPTKATSRPAPTRSDRRPHRGASRCESKDSPLDLWVGREVE